MVMSIFWGYLIGHPDPPDNEWASLAISTVLSLGPFAVAGIAMAYGPRLLRSSSRGYRGTGVLVLAALMSAGLAILAMVLFAALTVPLIGRTALGAVAIGVVFAVIGRVGSWRWRSWDERERRVLQQLPTPRVDRTAAIGYGLTLCLILGALSIGFALSAYSLVAIALVLTALLTLAGLAGDSLAEEDPIAKRRARIARRRAGASGTGGD